MKNEELEIVTSRIPVFRQKHYSQADEILLDDAKAVSAIAVKSVSINGSGGFPARNPADKNSSWR